MSVTYATADRTRAWLTKVPAITATFWVIKVLSTTIGETFSDYLAVNVGERRSRVHWQLNRNTYSLMNLSPASIPRRSTTYKM